MMMKNFAGFDQFIWFLGVVEDRHDPLGLGRVRVRAYGTHTDNLTEIPTSSLPWAHVAQSSNDKVFSTPKEDDLVFGFWADGTNMQMPVILGIIPGFYSEPPNPNDGFNDVRTNAVLKFSPKKPVGRVYNKDGSGIVIEEANTANTQALQTIRHPTPDELGHQTITGVSRYENLANTAIEARKQNRDIDVQTALGKQWSEPYPAYNPVYPFNQVIETESGHIFELDDTPGSERVAITHRSGSYVEWYPSGSKVEKITKSNYSVVMADDHIHIMGKVLMTVDSNAYVKIIGNVNLEVNNDINANVAGNVNFTVGKSFNVKSTDVNINASNDATIVSATQHLTTQNDMNFYSGGNLNSESGNDVNISGIGVLVGGMSVNINASETNIEGSTVNIKGSSETAIGGGAVDINGAVRIQGLISTNQGANSPGSAGNAEGAVPGSPASLGSAPPVEAPNNATVAPEPVPVPMLNGVVQFDAYTGEAYVQNLFLDQNPDGTYSDPGTNTANVNTAIAAANLTCNFDPASHTFISDSSTWQLGSAGLSLIKNAEGFAKIVGADIATAYPDPATHAEPITIGYGSTAPAIDQPVTLGQTITRDVAEQYLAYAINKKFIPTLREVVEVPLTQNMIDACLSLMYNIGTGNFRRSTLLKKINAQQWCDAKAQFLVWNKAAGRTIQGLTNRRIAEANLFTS